MSVETGQLFERRSNGAILRVEGFHENRSKARLENLETGRVSRVRVDRLEGPDYRAREDLRDGDGDPDFDTVVRQQGGVVGHFPTHEQALRQWQTFSTGPTVTAHLFDTTVAPEPVGPLHEPPSSERNWLPIIIALVLLMLPVSLALSALLS